MPNSLPLVMLITKAFDAAEFYKLTCPSDSIASSTMQFPVIGHFAGLGLNLTNVSY